MIVCVASAGLVDPTLRAFTWISQLPATLVQVHDAVVLYAWASPKGPVLPWGLPRNSYSKEPLGGSVTAAVKVTDVPGA